MPVRRSLRTLLVPFALSLPAVAPAADDAAPGVSCGAHVAGRPRVGLVLSGGGARGAAHAGVLEVLEARHIPVDCIVGTSAGAIVGGLYAAGLAPDQALATYTDVDWDRAFSDAPTRRIRSFRRKLDDATYLGRFEVGIVDGEVRLPSGVIAGQNINTLLKTATLHTYRLRDFDRLAIPFRAIATDMTTGEMVVLERGDLAQAMRASMSVPAIFAPVEIDGRLLADGGLVRNLPIDVARGMGAEVIIVVDAGTPLAQQSELRDIVGLTVQVINVLTQQNVDRSLATLGPQDLLLRPDLDGIGATDFERAREANQRGSDAARAADARLAPLVASDAEWAAYLAHQRRAQQALPRIDFVRVLGNQRVPTKLITARLVTAPGGQLDLKRVFRDIERVYAMDDFEQVFFDLVEEGASTGLEIKVREKQWGPNYLKAGLKVADDLSGASQFSLLVNHLRTNVNRSGGEWRNELKIGNPRGIASEFYQPFDESDDLFVAVGAQRDGRQLNLFAGDVRTSAYQRTISQLTLDIGRQISNFGEVRLGLRRGQVDNTLRIGAPGPLGPQEDIGALRLFASVDQLDQPYFPTTGYYARLGGYWSRQSLGATSDYERFTFASGTAFSHGRNTVVLEGEVGSSGGSVLPAWDQFTLGGFLSLSGYEYDQLRGDRYLSLRGLYYYRAPGLPAALADDLYFGMSLEAGNVWPAGSAIDASELRYGGSLWVGLNTLVGPVHVAVGLGEDSRIIYYFTLGRTF
jgi:NTE family protein